MFDKHQQSNRFSTSKRLKTAADYQRVYQSKQWGRNSLFTFNITKSAAKTACLGVTVSKKVSKNAVIRNRIKRQIKEFFRTHHTQLCNVDIVITARGNCLSASNVEMREALFDLWEKILKNQSRLC